MPPKFPLITEECIQIVRWWHETVLNTFFLGSFLGCFSILLSLAYFHRTLFRSFDVWKNLDELKKVVNDYVASLDEDEVRRAVRDVRPRTELCLKMGSGHFESQLKNYKRGTIEE